MILTRSMRIAALSLLFTGIAAGAESAATLTPSERVDALKSALTQAAGAAITTLGRTDGFMGDPEVRIPLPGKLEKASKTARKLGLSKQIDALTLAMNRAAEAAVPEARELVMESVRQMSVNDALGIIRGADNAATEYFRKNMSGKLAERFQPVVSKATASVKVAELYKDVAGKASALGLIDSSDASIDAYITRKTLDGLFIVMAREEAAIRKNPLGQANALLRRVFGSPGK